MTGLEPRLVAERLKRHVEKIEGVPAQVGMPVVMEDGHAGLTFGLDVTVGDAAPRACIIKTGPVGVPRRGSTDVARQAPMLQALHAAGLPVPAILWSAADEETLGTPFIVMERLAGRTFIIWEPHAEFDTSPETVRSLWMQAIAALAAIHRFDWSHALAGWEEPAVLSSEIERWHRLLSHAPEPEWKVAGEAVSRLLAAAIPPETPLGLTHGDFQPGNVLYHDGRLTGVIDWDLCAIAPQGIDVGWLLMMIDQEAWHPGWRPRAPLTRSELLAAYARSGGTALADLPWYQAFAQFRLGAIACLNVKLNRNGRRPDDLWERFAPSVSFLFSRAAALLAPSSALGSHA